MCIEEKLVENKNAVDPNISMTRLLKKGIVLEMTQMTS